MVTITDDLEADVSIPNKKVVVVMARIHPCDTASSYVIQGEEHRNNLLDFTQPFLYFRNDGVSRKRSWDSKRFAKTRRVQTFSYHVSGWSLPWKFKMYFIR